MTRRLWPIIIGGCHRSGTSLLRRILNAHSHIHCGPEVKFFRDFYGDYPSDGRWELGFMATARSLVPEDDLLELFGRTFVALHERAATRAGKLRWADKAPENILYLSQWQRLLGDDWRFIHVVRNPLDTLASIKEARFPRTIPGDLDGRIAFYDRYTRAGLAFAAAHPRQCHRLQYERLVLSPEGTLQGLMEWLGETFEPGQLAFNESPQQRGLEDPKVARSSHVHSESVGRWRTVLTPEEARTIRHNTRELWSALNPDGEYDLSA